MSDLQKCSIKFSELFMGCTAITNFSKAIASFNNSSKFEEFPKFTNSFIRIRLNQTQPSNTNSRNDERYVFPGNHTESDKTINS